MSYRKTFRRRPVRPQVELLEDRCVLSTPSSGTLTLLNTADNPVVWTGGPLTGRRIGEPDFTNPNSNFYMGPEAYDDFMLTIQVPPANDAGRKRIVELELAPEAGKWLELMVYPPSETGEDAIHTGYERYPKTAGNGNDRYRATPVRARLIEPEAGEWRMRVLASPPEPQTPTENALYSAKAWTTTVPVITSPMPEQGPMSFTTTRLPETGGGEPDIQVDKQNHVFISAPFTNSGPSVFRSLDAGQTFSRTTSFSHNSLDSDLAVAPEDNGSVYFVNRHSRLGLQFFGSQDHGTTYPRWCEPPCENGPVIITDNPDDRPWLTTGPNGLIYLASKPDETDATGSVTSAAESRLVFRASTDGGNTWEERATLTFQGNVKLRPGVIDPADPNRIYLFLAMFGGGARGGDKIVVAKSIDGGRNWSQHEVADIDPPGVANPAVGDRDADGNLYVTWPELGIDGNTRIMMAASTDDGLSWHTPTQVDQLVAQRSNVMPWLAAGVGGRVDIAWYTSPAPIPQSETATWTVALARSTDADSAEPHFSQSRVSPDVVHVGILNMDGPTTPFADFMGMDIGSDGRAHIVYNHDAFYQMTPGESTGLGTTTGQVLIMHAREIRRMSISDVTAEEGDDGFTTFQFTVSLSVASTQSVTVSYSTADGTARHGTDYLPTRPYDANPTAEVGLTFAPGETTKTIIVRVKGDTDVESDETFFVNLTSPTNATLGDSRGVGMIVNDDSSTSGDTVGAMSSPSPSDPSTPPTRAEPPSTEPPPVDLHPASVDTVFALTEEDASLVFSSSVDDPVLEGALMVDPLRV